MLGNKLLNIQFAKYHIWNNKRETFNQSVRKNTVTQYHQCLSREIMEDTPVRRKRKHKSPKMLSKNRVKKFGETLGEKAEVRIFANFDNFATFVDRAVFT